uniref:Universal stress protein n=1 Tax=candidate division WOR-3 bacterium TaxID=2052148 RepID=A0A7C6AFH9_UNCW3
METKEFTPLEFPRILLYIVDNTDQAIFTPAIQFCKLFKSQLFVLFVLEEHRISKLASITHENIESIKKRIEEEGWEMLYLVEDEAVESGVRTSLHMENGQVPRVVKKYLENYKINLMLVRKREETKKIFVSANVPVIGL